METMKSVVFSSLKLNIFFVINIYTLFRYVCKVKVNLALEQAMRAQRGSRSITLLFL